MKDIRTRYDRSDYYFHRTDPAPWIPFADSQHPRTSTLDNIKLAIAIVVLLALSITLYLS